MRGNSSTLVCAGCGTQVSASAPLTFRCLQRQEGDDIEHILVRRLDALAPADLSATNPFVRYRERLHSWHRAVAHGLTDADFCDTAETINARLLAQDGRQFTVTPLTREPALAKAIGFAGTLLVKDETGNVSGSHKARHMMGVALHLALSPSEVPEPRLAIASCGNAGLAAATLAYAIERTIEVYLPELVDPLVHESLRALHADTVLCPREEGRTGDPSYYCFLDATREGALPFTCQGPDNGLTIEGGCTLGYELADQLTADGLALDVLFIQVGGGALGSGTSQALQEVYDAEELPRLPQIHTVQTFGAYPLFRAYERFMKRVFPETELFLDPGKAQTADALRLRLERAAEAKELWATPLLDELFTWAKHHRSELMWAWEEDPASIAHGILDDETYDWLALLEAMVRTGGLPIVAAEDVLRDAQKRARAHTTIPADPTGTSGLAGLETLHQVLPLTEDQTVAVIFTGVDRHL